MAEFMVTSATLNSKAAELESFNNELKAQVDKLATSEEALSGMWEGEAREAFRKAFNDDKVQMLEFYNAIVTYVNALREIAKKYDQAEATNVSTAKTRNY